jgi:2'-deoxynucleoside 5'-phosphate N-hydrolase
VRDRLQYRKARRCMKIYFGFTVAGDRSSLSVARHLVSVLEALGHQVLTRHLVSDDASRVDRRIGPRDVYNRDLAWLRECDMFIGEVSGSSFGLGFEAGYLLGATEKPVVLMYSAEVEPKISLMITGNTHPRCTLVPYANPREAEDSLSRLLRRVSSKLAARSS